LAGYSWQQGDAGLQRALELRDPYLSAATLGRDSFYFVQKIDPAFLNSAKEHVAYMAGAAAACEIVGDCVDSYLVMTPCLAGGICNHSDFREFLRADLDPQARILFDKAKRSLLAMVGR
jgi:hypothetical protein